MIHGITKHNEKTTSLRVGHMTRQQKIALIRTKSMVKSKRAVPRKGGGTGRFFLGRVSCWARDSSCWSSCRSASRALSRSTSILFSSLPKGPFTEKALWNLLRSRRRMPCQGERRDEGLRWTSGRGDGNMRAKQRDCHRADLLQMTSGHRSQAFEATYRTG